MGRRVRHGDLWGLLGTASLVFGLSKSTTGHPAFGGLLALAGVFLLFVAYRNSRMGAYVEEESLVVRNGLRTYRLPWDSIAEFRLVGTTTVWVHVDDGRKVHIWGMSCYPLGKGYVPLTSMLDELRAVAAERRARTTSLMEDDGRP